jgi:hypothetical protein
MSSIVVRKNKFFLPTAAPLEIGSRAFSDVEDVIGRKAEGERGVVAAMR